jgi:recombinational DNA repair ATPase RecF
VRDGGDDSFYFATLEFNWCNLFREEQRLPVMITQLRFQNFKALKNAELKLGAFNVIVGPNGSGKSSVLQALKALVEPQSMNLGLATTVGMELNSAVIQAACENRKSL